MILKIYFVSLIIWCSQCQFIDFGVLTVIPVAKSEFEFNTFEFQFAIDLECTQGIRAWCCWIRIILFNQWLSRHLCPSLRIDRAYMLRPSSPKHFPSWHYSKWDETAHWHQWTRRARPYHETQTSCPATSQNHQICLKENCTLSYKSWPLHPDETYSQSA